MIFRLPTSLILFTFNSFKYFLVSLFCGYATVILLKIDFENALNFSHFLNDFFVILALIKIKGIFLFFKAVDIPGQISESTNIAI